MRSLLVCLVVALSGCASSGPQFEDPIAGPDEFVVAPHFHDLVFEATVPWNSDDPVELATTATLLPISSHSPFCLTTGDDPYVFPYNLQLPVPQETLVLPENTTHVTVGLAWETTDYIGNHLHLVTKVRDYGWYESPRLMVNEETQYSLAQVTRHVADVVFEEVWLCYADESHSFTLDRIGEPPALFVGDVDVKIWYDAA